MADTKQRAARRRNLSFYLTKDEQAQAAEVARLEGVDAEIALLRLLIKKAKGGDDNKQVDLKEVRLQIEALCKALRLQHLLSGRSGDALADSLAQALDEIAVQMEAEP